MNEGLHLFPWIKEMGRRGDLVISDCEKCMKSTQRQQRQALGCGYEPPGTLPVMMWEPPRSACGYSGPPPTVCPGYSTSLPEVIETAIIRRHWEKGAVTQACGGDPTEDTLLAILIIDGAFSDVKHWGSMPSKDGGGGS